MFTKKIQIIGASAALIALCLGSVVSAAPKPRDLLADGELFTSEMVLKSGKLVYKNKTADTTKWVWHNEKGYPEQLTFATFIYGTGLPEKAEPIPGVNGIPTTMDMAKNAFTKNAVKANTNTLFIYATTGPSAAKTDIKIVKAELFGRLLNVTVALKDAEPNQPLTMNLIYPEATAAIPLSKLPRFGTLRIRIADTQGHALRNMDTAITED